MARKKLNIKARLKVYLLLGKSITHNQALKRWRTNRLASYVHRLKDEMFELGYYIDCRTEVSKDGHQYGVYSLQKISRL